MPIYKYQKVSDQYTTYTLRAAEGQFNQELCTINGDTYHFVDGDLPAGQFEQLSIAAVTLDAATVTSVKMASPVIQLIDQKVREAIAERYSISDEIKMLRLGSGPEFDAYNAYCEDCRTWGRTERAKFGL